MATTIRIGDARVDFSTLSIDGPAGQFSIEPKVMNLLQVLVDEAGTVVSRADLLSRVWGENFGGDESLSRAVSLLRRAFGQVRGGVQYIETVPKRGYRLAATVNAAADGEQPPETLSSPPVTGRWWLAAVGIILAIVLAAYFILPGEQTGEAGPASSPGGALEEGAAPGPQVSIAVLPFEDLSEAGDQQYLSDGLAEEILNALVRFSGLRVIGRTSSFNYSPAGFDLGEINTTLGVSHVLTGSLRKQGSRVRITARLVESASGSNLWAQSYDGDMSDIFDLQEDIAQKIAGSLGLVLDLEARNRFVPKLTDNRQAYDLFLQGRALSRKFGHRNKAKSRELLGRAVALDPNFAAAWAFLGQANLFLTLTSGSDQVAGLVSSARHAVERALSLDPELAMGHYVRTILLDYDLDFAGSIDAVEKAYELNPSQPFLEIRRGYYQGVIGRSRLGAERMEQGLQSDPTDSVGLLNLGVANQALGGLELATSLLQRSEDLGFVPAAGQVCNILVHKQLPDAAYKCWVELPTDFRRRYSPLFQSQQQWSMLGRAVALGQPEAREKVRAMLDEYFSEAGSRSRTYLLQLYLTMGDAKRFMEAFVSHPYPLNAGALTLIWDDQAVHRKLRQHLGFPGFAQRVGLLRAWQKYGWPDRCQKIGGGDGSSEQFSCD